MKTQKKFRKDFIYPCIFISVEYLMEAPEIDDSILTEENGLEILASLMNNVKGSLQFIEDYRSEIMIEAFRNKKPMDIATMKKLYVVFEKISRMLCKIVMEKDLLISRAEK